jgi:hypothetical protein
VEPNDRVGASGLGISFNSDLTGIGVDGVETPRRGVGLGTSFGSFFLCERFPMLVRWDAVAGIVG